MSTRWLVWYGELRFFTIFATIIIKTMKKIAITLLCALAFAACTNNQPEDNKNNQNDTKMENTAKVYLTREISPEALVKIYKALGVEAKGRVAVKISTGK